jgi:hypothetical protein
MALERNTRLDFLLDHFALVALFDVATWLPVPGSWN